VALLQRHTSIEQAEREINRSTSAPLEHFFDMGGRSVLLPIATSWIILRVSQFSALQALFGEIDSFIETHNQKYLAPSLLS
jgi:hypothetical protein